MFNMIAKWNNNNNGQRKILDLLYSIKKLFVNDIVNEQWCILTMGIYMGIGLGMYGYHDDINDEYYEEQRHKLERLTFNWSIRTYLHMFYRYDYHSVPAHMTDVIAWKVILVFIAASYVGVWVQCHAMHAWFWEYPILYDRKLEEIVPDVWEWWYPIGLDATDWEKLFWDLKPYDYTTLPELYGKYKFMMDSIDVWVSKTVCKRYKEPAVDPDEIEMLRSWPQFREKEYFIVECRLNSKWEGFIRDKDGSRWERFINEHSERYVDYVPLDHNIQLYNCVEKAEWYCYRERLTEKIIEVFGKDIYLELTKYENSHILDYATNLTYAIFGS